MPSHEVVVGIDPGLKGALAVFETATGDLLDKIPLPDPSDVLPLYKYLYTLKGSFPSLIIACEKAQTVPGRDSVKSAFTNGRNFGKLEAVIRLLYCPVQYIPPVTWQAELHKGTDGSTAKEKSLSVAKNLWPCEDFVFSHLKSLKTPRRAHDGLVDAMLIGEFLRRRVRG